MTTNLLLQRSDNLTMNVTMNSFCAAGGGVWSATQALIAFLVTNIFAHGATIYLANGSDAWLTVKSVFQALLLPVNAGDQALNALSRWGRRLWKGRLGIKSVFGGFSFEDAATAGAIAISVPLEFVPLLHGRWDTVNEHQRIVMLNNKEFWNDEDWSYRASPGGLPFKISDKYPRYVPYILPPTTRFSGYKKYKLAPQSSALPQLIAVIQAVLSSHQLYLKYDTSIRRNGLASPFVVVIPYLLMSLVNLVANTLVGSYTQITMLPMATSTENVPEKNEVYIGNWQGDDVVRVIAIAGSEENIASPDSPVSQRRHSTHSREKETHITRTARKTPIEIGAASAINDSNIEIRHRPLNEDDEISRIEPPGLGNEHALRLERVDSQNQGPEFIEEFDGKEWHQFQVRQGWRRGEIPVGKLGINRCVEEVSVINLYWLRVIRQETWSPVCYQIRWKIRLGKKKKDGSNPPNDSNKHQATFFSQNSIIGVRWNPMKRNIPKSERTEYVEKFETWLSDNYPGVEIPFDKNPSQLGFARFISGPILQLLVTAILGGLTRFKVGTPSHACWLLIWMYGGSTLRWMELINFSMDKEPCLSFLKRFVFELGRVFAIFVTIGIYGGITVISVELLGAFCDYTISLHPIIWTAIGAGVGVLLLLIGIGIIFATEILGFLIWVVTLGKKKRHAQPISRSARPRKRPPPRSFTMTQRSGTFVDVLPFSRA